MAASQIQGFTTANVAEVEAATKALRVTLRPEDYGALGIYSLGGASGTMAAALAAGAEIYQFRWGNASNLALIKRVVLSVGSVAAFTAQAMAIEMKKALVFSASGSGGTSLLPSGNQSKLRTSGMGTTLVTDVRIASTAALGAGTETLDTNPLGSVVFGAPATAGAQMLAPFPLFDVQPGEHPLVLAQNEGFVLRNVIVLPAAGTWSFGVTVVWSELNSY